MWSVPGYGEQQSYLQIDEDLPLCYEVEGGATDNESDDEFVDEPEEPDAVHEEADPTPSTISVGTRKNSLQSDFDLDGPSIKGPILIDLTISKWIHPPSCCDGINGYHTCQ
jgi:hypothetical protein